MNYLTQFLTAGLLFAAIDSVWLSLIANRFYKAQIGELLLDKPNLLAAVAFYVIFLVGLVVFVIAPALSAGSWKLAVGLGGLFGLVTYATYDLTNLATLKGWTMKLVAVDLLWGTVLSASVAGLTYLILSRI